ncbi:MAG: RluA family pseudouridine synthase [Myxococcota bacterium]
MTNASLMDVSLLFEDEHLLVVAKPSGLAVHRGLCRDGPFLVDVLRAHSKAPLHPVHRLDRGTSGALIIAKHVTTARALGVLFQQGSIEKSYLALVRGTAPTSAIVEHAIPDNKNNKQIPAETAVCRLASVRRNESPLRERTYSLVEAHPKTGRFHQVRRHLKHLGHPLIGDVNYGRSEHNRWCREHFGLARLALHAHRLRLPHPSTGDPLAVFAPLPVDLHGPLVAMGFEEQCLNGSEQGPR